MMRKVLLMIVAVVSCNAVFGQLSGVKSIPGDYATIQAAVTDLNTQGVGSGGVTFNVAAGHTESVTAPILITATGTASNPIVFQKSAAGMNPVITRTDPGSISPTALGAQGDAVVILQGSDYISFINIDLTTVDMGIEYGYFLRKASVTDGCKNISILSCNITMTKGTSNYVAGIYSSNLDAASPSSSATGITVTSEGGRNENVTINGNTILNCHTGILLRGFSHSSSPYNFYDQNFIVGASGNGNIISNYGNTATAYGIYSIYQNNINFSYNTISSDPNHNSTLYGISVSTATKANVTLNNNEVTIQTNTASSASYGLSNAAGSSGTTNTVNIQNNIVSGLVSPLVTSASFYGIQNTGSAFLVNINNNQITGNTLGTGSTTATGSFYGISSSGSNSTSGSITNINDNEISGNARQQSAPGSGTFYGISCTSSGLSLNVFNNNVSNNDMPTTTSTQYILYITASSSVKKIYNNQLYAHLNSGGNIYGIYNSSGTDVEIYKNNIYDLNGTYTSASYSTSGIYISSGTNVSVYNNYISDLKNINSTNQNAVNGIYISGGTNVRTYYNTIYLDASSSSAGNFGTNGIYCATAPIVDIKNNIVVNNSTPGPTGFAVALRYAGVSITNYNGNYNDWYAGSPSAQNLIFYDGTNSDQDIVAFQSRVNPDDNASFSSVPPFVNIATTPYDLHLQTTVATKCESGGLAITTPVNITGDYDGDARYPNAGYPDNPSYPATSPDVGADEFAGIPSFTCGAPSPGNTLASTNNICLGQSVTLSLEFPPSGTGLSYDWQSSSDGITFTGIPGANQITYTVTPTDEAYYQCVVTCQNGPSTGTSSPVQITFSSEITSTTPGSRCGTGTVQLAATGTGTEIKWYENASGGLAIGTGSPFTTPVISATTTYYVATNSGSTNIYGARPAPTGTSVTTASNYGLVFTATQPFTLVSVDVYATAAGNVVIQLQNSSGTMLQSATVPVVAGSTTVPQTLTLNFNVPAGNDLRLIAVSSPNMVRESSLGGFPYSLGAFGNITSGYIGGTSTTYYYFYNWYMVAGCSSPREAVVATVTTPPLLSLTSDQTICNNAITSIQVTSNIPDYDTYVWSPVTNLFTDAACTTPYLSGTSATTVYFQSNVPATTTYTCTATNNTSLCVENKTSAITVLPVASTITASPASLCISGTSSLTVDPASGYGAATFQWQNSPDGTTFTDISGATTLNYTTPVINTTTHYKLIIKDGTGNICLQPQVTVNVSSPLLTGTTPGSRCGSGTVTLAATNNPTSVLYWYNVATGGAPLASGSPFTTPVISTTTNYYAAAENHYNANITVGSGVSTSTGYQGPFYYYYGAEKSQYLIPASELQAAGLVVGNITALAFNITSNGATFNDFSLNIGHTSQSALTTTFVSGLSNVYTTAGITPTAGIFTITFDTPFNWDGSSNLVVETCWGNNNGGATPHAHVKYDATSYIATAYQRQDNVTAAVFCPGTSAYGTYSSRPQLIFSGVTSCSTPRTMVTATVTPAPALTITGDQTICNDAAGMIQVTSTLSDYDSYIWTPTAGLYTDAGCTTPYVGGTSATTVYIKTTIGGQHTIYCNANNTVSLCSEIDTTVITVLPASASISGLPENICYSGSSILNLNPASGYGAGSLQWQDSPDNITFTDISGQTGPSYTTPSLTNTTYYQVVIKDGSGNTCLTPQFTLSVNSPQITGTTPYTRCGVGTVDLEATANTGATLNWYVNAVGGAPIGTGSPFTTPVITSTTNYYVAASQGSSIITTGRTAPTATSGTTLTNYGLVFDALSNTTIFSVDVYPATTAGSMNIALYNSSQTMIAGPVNYAFPAGGGTTPHTVNLGFAVPAGTGYRLMITTMSGGNLVRESSGITYPYTSSAVNITAGATSLTGTSSSVYYWFYNWKVIGSCESARTMVTATVNPAPALNISATPAVICLNDNSNLEVSSANDPNYSYNWMPGSLSGATHLVSPVATTIYTVTATDASGGPNDGCVNTASVSVTVNPLPSSVSVTPPAANLCAGDIQMLTASGGIGTTSGTVGTGTASNTSSTPYRGYYGGTKVQLLYTAAELTALGFVSGSQITQVSFNISSFTSPYNYTDFYIAMKNTTSTATATALETGLTQVFSTPLFTLSGTTPFTVSHVLDTPFSWDGTSNLLVETCYNNNDGGGISANNANLVSTSTSPNYYAAYYSSDNNATVCSAPGTATRTYTRPNIGLVFTVPSPITWAPTSSLYTDAGGTIPYTGTPATTVYAMPSTTTTYTATATNQFTCTSAGTAVIAVAPISIGSVNTTQISCNGASDASITVSASGGSGTLQYSIDNGVNWQTSNVFTPLAAGTYNVVVKDALNCEQSYSGNPIVLSNPDVLTASASVTSAILCFGGTATVTITATGGTTPYTYTFNGVTNATGVFTGIPAGTGYSWSADDANGCGPVTGTLNVGEPVLLTGGASVTSAILCNGGTATVTLTASGGTTPYSYTFNGVTNATGIFTGVPAGLAYAWSITDANTCGPVTGTLNVSEPVLLTGGASVTSAISCNGGTATVTLTASGGTTPYSYTFNGVTNSTGIFTGIAAGSAYAWSITDANTCGPVTGNLNVAEPVVFAANASVTSTILCNGGTGTVTITATGGTTPYTYTFNGVTNATGVFTGISAGTSYNWSADDANVCGPVTGTLNVSEPVLLTGGALVTSAILCNGGTATVTLTASGGTTPYSYTFNGVTNATGIFTGIPAGTAYSWSVTDANTCGPVTGTLNVSEPVLLTGGASVTSVISCNGGTATVTLTASGGTTPYSYTFNGVTNATGIFTGIPAGTAYAWSITDANTCGPVTGNLNVAEPVVFAANASVTSTILCNGGTGTVTITATGGTTPYTYTFNGVTNATGVFTGILAGTSYNWSADDANTCGPVTGTLSVSEPPAIVLSLVSVTTPILCNGDNGQFTVSASGGTGALEFSANNGASWQSSNVFTLPSGNYTIVVRDANLCEMQYSGNPFNLPEPPAIVIASVVPTDVTTCGATDGTITISASGGTGALEYSIDNGSGWFASNYFQNLPSGPYYIQVKDVNGCIITYSSNPVLISAPSAVIIDNVVPTDVFCYGDNTGTITVTASAGTSPYEYSNDGGISYVSNSGIFSAVYAGSYNIAVKDNVGCITLYSGNPITINEPGPLSANAAVTSEIDCNGGTATVTLTASGGTTPYSYTFNGVTNATGIFTGIAAGTAYAWSVTDANTCGPVTGTLNVAQPDIFTANASVTSAIACSGGTATVTLTASGGTLPYTYTFNGVTNATGIFTGIIAGTGYAWSVNDANSCGPVTGTLNVAEPVLLTGGASITSAILCNGGTATVTLTASGGTSPYSYTFNGVTNATGIFTGITAGTAYAWSITDANTCGPVTGNLDVNEPVLLTAGASVTSAITCNGGTATVTLTASGGTTPYAYTFNGITNATGIFTGIAAGTAYAWSVTDANTCGPVTGTLSVAQPDIFTANASVTSAIACSGGTATVTLTASGGTTPYTYTFNGVTNATGIFTGIIAGTGYAWSVNDANTCGPVTGSLNVSEPVLLTGGASVTSAILCNGGTATVTLTASGGTTPYSYTFNGVTNATGIFTGVTAGTAYGWSITDANTCGPVTGTLNVSEPVLLTGGASVTSVISCNGGTATVTLTASGGTTPYSYTFNGVTNATGIFTGIPAGTAYAWSITDANTCGPVTGTLNVSQPDLFTANAAVTAAIACNGGTATVTLTASGGTIPYTYTFNGVTNATGIFTGIIAGTGYAWSVNDANTCGPVTGSLNVSEPLLLTGGASVTSAILCNGGTATVTLTAGGGTAPLSYTFNGVTNATGIFTGILAGTSYAWSITDANTCGPVTGTLNVSEPVLLTGGASVTSAISCNGGTATVTLTASGGTMPYSYTFNGVTNATGIFTGITAGTAYAWSITDANTCGPVTGTLNVTQPDLFAANAAVTAAIACSGGTATVTITATGGTTPYTFTFNGVTNATGIFTGIIAGTGYAWSVNDANTCGPVTGTLNVSEPVLLTGGASVTSAILCNGGTATITLTASGGTIPYSFTFNGVTNATGIFTGITAGTAYAWSITDANTCGPVTGTLNVTQPALIDIDTVVKTNATCYGVANGSLTITATGGTGTLLYSIDNGSNWQASPTFNNLPAGNNTIKVKDANNCITTYTYNPVIISQPAVIAVTGISTTPASCFGENDASITITASGGTGPLAYSIDNGASWQPANMFGGLFAGNYQVKVSDSLNCIVSYASNPVVVSQPAAVVVDSVKTTNATCYGQPSGTITVYAHGGNGIFEYSVDNGANWQSANLFNVAGGFYNVKVRDTNGCEGTYAMNPVEVFQPDPILYSGVDVTHISCNGSNDGKIAVYAYGGTGGLQYSIDSGATWQASYLFTGLNTGNYNVITKDAAGCAQAYPANPVIITEPPLLSVAGVIIHDVSCFGGNDGSIVIDATGGTGAYEFSVDSGYTWVMNDTVSGLIAGSYNVMVRDSNLCQSVWASNPVMVAEPAELIITQVDSTDVTTVGGSDGTITVHASGGTGTIQYSIDGGTTWQNNGGLFTGLTVGDYIVWVKDSNDCITEWVHNPVHLSDPTGIGTATSNENYINLYPNPAKEEVIIEAKGLGQVASIEILSFDGKVVDVLRFIDNNANELYVKYNFAAFARGVYFIRINETGGVHLRKLILN